MRGPRWMRRRCVGMLVVCVGLLTVQAGVAGGQGGSATIEAVESGSGTTVLGGRIVRPGGVLAHGWVVVRDGRIRRIQQGRPAIPGADYVETGGTILPGLIDLHNHVQWNVLPRWQPPAVYTNRSQWRSDPDYQADVGDPFSALVGDRGCDMNAYGELRALVGGATSVMTTRASPCIIGLVRNLDWNSGFYGRFVLGSERVASTVDIPPSADAPARADFVTDTQAQLADPGVEGLLYHLGEGVDAAAEEEFDFFAGADLLADEVNLIHGTGLDAADFAMMAESGAGLVWSPRSNLELYETTTDVGAALDAGVEVALSPDWAVTGSSNLLDEVRTADLWDANNLGNRLDARDLLDMVTSVPARLVGIDDEVGAIRVGLRADLLVIDDRAGLGPQALLGARPGDIDLVMVGGEALYGEPAVVEALRGPTPRIGVRGTPRSVAMPPTMGPVTGLRNRLSAALAGQGTALAPLTGG